jgi:hypothetical protein
MGKNKQDKSEVSIPQEVEEVLERCNTEDPAPKDVKALRHYLRTTPGLWRRYGDMIGITMEAVWRALPKHPTVVESFKQARLELRKELGVEQASTFERLLIEHVIVCWFQMQFTSALYSTYYTESTTIDLKQYYCRMLSAAQRRYLRACETLARIRRMSLPTVRVNVNARCKEEV